MSRLAASLARLLLVGLMPVLLTATWLASAAELSAQAPRAPRSYRPVLVPDAQKTQFIRGMVPIRKDIFQRQWKLLRSKDALTR